MTLHRATPADLPALKSFLRAREGGSMFLLSNLHAGRVVWPGEAEHDDLHASHLWFARTGAEVTGVLGLTRSGTLLLQMPDGAARGGITALAGNAVATVIGPDGQVPRVLDDLGLSDRAQRHRDEEPGFTLALADLILPDMPRTHARPLREEDTPLLTEWRVAYLGEVFHVPTDAARPVAEADVARWIAQGTHRLLIHKGMPVALTGFNAVLPEAVQVGAVYTPPALRRQGLARRLVALHLAEARDQGVARAHLFAANDAAARAYTAIGFRPRGTMGIVQFHGPETIRA